MLEDDDRKKIREKIINEYYDCDLVSKDDTLISFKTNIFVLNAYEQYIISAYWDEKITAEQYSKSYLLKNRARDGIIDIVFAEGVPHIKEK